MSSPPGAKYGWQQLPEAIKALEAGEEIDYQGASGAIDIEPLDLAPLEFCQEGSELVAAVEIVGAVGQYQ